MKTKYKQPRIDRIKEYCRSIKGLVTNLEISVENKNKGIIKISVSTDPQSSKEALEKALNYIIGEFIKVLKKFSKSYNSYCYIPQKRIHYYHYSCPYGITVGVCTFVPWEFPLPTNFWRACYMLLILSPGHSQHNIENVEWPGDEANHPIVAIKLISALCTHEYINYYYCRLIVNQNMEGMV